MNVASDPVLPSFATPPGGVVEGHPGRPVDPDAFENELRELREPKPDEPRWLTLRLFLKYGPRGERVISGLRRVSRPGRRVYFDRRNVPRVLGGLGTSILTTSHGVMTDREAVKAGVGGEVLCNVW